MATEAQTQELSSCQTCAKILGAFTAPFEKRYEIELGVVSELLASSCAHTQIIAQSHTIWTNESDYLKRPLSILKRANETGACFAVFWHTSNSNGVRNGHELGLVFRKGNHGRIRVLDSAWADVQSIKDWRTRCMEEHGASCHKHRLSMIEPAQPLWLIDVESGCLVRGKEGGNARVYVALSYTWGQTKTYKTVKSNFDSLQQPRALYAIDIESQIPRTILDAIGVVKVIGERYLWVDSLCIVQDDLEMLGVELNRMHLIYANSFVTILAEAGADAEHGLRGIKGISKPRSISQPFHHLADDELLTLHNERWEPPSHAEVGYRSRAWTFQEYIFAKRRLVFGDGRITWQCNSAAWFEDLLPNKSVDAYIANQDTWGQYNWMNMEVPSLQALSPLIQVFNQKKLTFEEDASKAFAGFRTYLQSLQNGPMLFGLPEVYFDLALFWLGNVDLKRRIRSDFFQGDPLQDNLPSWSWLGWEGRVKFPEDCEFETTFSTHGIGFQAPMTKWYTLETPTAARGRLINSQWHIYRAQSANEELPAGWRRVEYPLGAPMAAGFAYRPKEYQPYLYKHESVKDTHIYWYTIPAIDPKFSVPPNVQTQYLYCETTRAFLYATTDRLIDIRGSAKLQVLHDEFGEIAGGIHLNVVNPRDDEDQSALRSNVPTTPGENRIELVAIAKGWTIHFKKCGLNQQRGWMAGPDWVIPDADENDDINTRKWKEERSAKDDCVFVLWIRWDHGVAYRLGTGIVLEDSWNRLKEDVKLVLG